MFTVLVSGFLASAAPALAQDSDPQSESPPGATVRRTVTPGFPDAFKPYFDCRMEGVERHELDGFEIVSYRALNDKACEPELLQAREALRAAAGVDQGGSAELAADRLYSTATQQIGQLANSGSVVFQPTSDIFGSSFEVPPGMWDYFVCLSRRSGWSVSLQGEAAAPRFPDDDDCSRTRAFSRDQAAELLTSYGVPTEKHEGLIQEYVEQVDQHIRSREAERESRSRAYD